MENIENLNTDTVSATNQPTQLSASSLIYMNLRIDGLLESIEELLETPNEELLSKMEEVKSIQDKYLKSLFNAFYNEYDALLKLGIRSAYDALEDAHFSLAFWESDLGKEAKQKLDGVTDTSEVFSNKYLRPKIEEWLNSTDTELLERKPVFTTEAARSIVNTSVHHILDYLTENSADHANELRKAIDSIIKESPYVYEEGAEPTSNTSSVDVVTALATERILSKAYMPLLNGTPQKALASIGKVAPKIDKIVDGGTAIFEKDDFKLTLSNLNDLKGGKPRISTHKLLSTGIATFTESNHIGKKRKLREPVISIDLVEFAKECGCDLEIKETESEAEALKEKKRVQTNLKNFRREVRKDAKILLDSKIEWEDNAGKYKGVNILGTAEVSDSKIILEFSYTFANAILKQPLSQYPTALLKIDNRRSTAYNIGLKLAEHYSMDSNRRRGTENLLRIKYILPVTNLPDINSPSVEKGGWRDRIKEPFEDALEYLRQTGVISDWYYSHSKGVRMTNEEATSFDSFDDWKKTLICFYMKDFPDQSNRLDRREAEKVARLSKSKNKASKKNAASK